MRALVGLALGVAAMAAGPRAWATPSARLAYARSADAATCPDEPALRKAVAARFGYDPFFPWATQTVIVQVWRDHERFASRVQIIDPSGIMRGTRELTSDDADCADLFDATALAISIALDASIAAAAQPLPVAPPPPAPPSPPPEGPTVELPLPTPVDQAPRRPPRRPSPFAMGVDVFDSVGFAPHSKTSPGLAIAGELRFGAVSLGLEARFAASLPVSVYPPNARIETAQGTFGLVPCAHLGPAFACPLGEVGWFQAWGAGLAQNASHGTWLLALGGRLGAEVPLTRSLAARFYVEGVVDVDRPVFVIDGLEDWTAPPFAGSLGAGLIAKIP